MKLNCKSSWKQEKLIQNVKYQVTQTFPQQEVVSLFLWPLGRYSYNDKGPTCFRA